MTLEEQGLEKRVLKLEERLADERDMSHRAWVSLSAKMRGLEQEWKDYEDEYRSFMTTTQKLRFKVINFFRWIMRKDMLSPEEKLQKRMARVFYHGR